jgi:hypothetical protein
VTQGSGEKEGDERKKMEEEKE